MRGSVPARGVVLAVFFGWSVLTTLREWLGIYGVPAQTAPQNCPTRRSAMTLAADGPRVSVRIPPRGPRGGLWLN